MECSKQALLSLLPQCNRRMINFCNNITIFYHAHKQTICPEMWETLQKRPAEYETNCVTTAIVYPVGTYIRKCIPVIISNLYYSLVAVFTTLFYYQPLMESHTCYRVYFCLICCRLQKKEEMLSCCNGSLLSATTCGIVLQHAEETPRN